MGIRLDFQVIDAGALINDEYTYAAGKYTADWDLFIWYWVQDVDPNFIMDIYTPQQIEGWNDCGWTDPEYTKLDAQQIQTIDEAKRIPIVQKMQQIFYQGAAYAILAYPYQLEASDTGRLEGLGPRAGQRAGRAAGHRALQLQQHRHVPVRRATGGADRRQETVRELEVARHRPGRHPHPPGRHVVPEPPGSSPKETE